MFFLPYYFIFFKLFNKLEILVNLFFKLYAFIELLDGANATEEELIAFAREKLAGFKTPKKIIFQELPKTSTGKIQKFELRKSFG